MNGTGTLNTAGTIWLLLSKLLPKQDILYHTLGVALYFEAVPHKNTPNVQQSAVTLAILLLFFKHLLKIERLVPFSRKPVRDLYLLGNNEASKAVHRLPAASLNQKIMVKQSEIIKAQNG